MESFERTESRRAAVALAALMICTSATASAESTMTQASEAQARWVSSTGLSANASLLLARIDELDTHGLDPEAFDLRGLQAGVKRVFGDSAKRHERSYPVAVAALDYRFRRAFTDVARALGQGVVDARSVQRRLFRDPPEIDTRALLERLDGSEETVADVLDDVAPSNPAYERLRAAATRLLAERDAGNAGSNAASPGDKRRDETRLDGTRRILRPHATLQEGHAGHDVELLRRRLAQTGELAHDPTPTASFDSTLTEAVKAFQRRHGITADGIVAERTLAALNRSVEDDIAAVAMTLERWRWMPRQLGERHVFVNLPDYRLQLFDQHEKLADMAVVIGATKHQTPSFSQPMTYLEFNPTWTVPVSITNEELIPLERRNPGYLAARNFTMLRNRGGGQESISPSAMTPEELASVPFPYTLRQRGGVGNALGRMKFMMPNPYSVYLHDTPARHLFAKDERAYSHGCIRLAEPDRLATLLLQLDGMSPNAVAGALANPATHRVALRTTIQTHLTYFTTWVDESGTLQHRKDIYGHDEPLRAALGSHRAGTVTAGGSHISSSLAANKS